MDDHGTAWKARISKAQKMLEERLLDDVGLDELARAATYSQFHFHRLFRAATGETVRQYQRRLRLERAAYFLTHGQDDILKLALDAGYGSHEAFTRAFQTRFQITPSAFRAERRLIHEHKIMPMTEIDVRIAEREPQCIAFVRHVGPYEQLRYEACMVVKPGTKVKAPLEIKEIPGGTYAVVMHEGAYKGFAGTYARLIGRICSGPIDGKQWQLGDPPALEKYLNDPRKTKPEELRTEVWLPVKL
ncbi:MAG: AraC family transcriptional regulator [Planctomycetes bacterium]|nr:AraC family transcriptional regulator [Planctomycetota bacterium]